MRRRARASALHWFARRGQRDPRVTLAAARRTISCPAGCRARNGVAAEFKLLRPVLIDLSLHSVALLSLGTFVVSLTVAAFGPTGGLQLAIVAMVAPPPLTIPLHAWISSTSAVFRTITLWKHIVWTYFAAFAGVSVAASLVGIWATTRIDTHVLEVIVGLTIVYSAVRLSWPRKSLALTWLSLPVIAGAVTGFITIFVGASGPLLLTLMSSRFRERQELMATHSVCLSLQHFSKLVLFGAVGVAILSHPVLLGTITLASASGTWVGKRVLQHTPERTYRITLSVFMFSSGVFVLAKALFWH